MGTIASDDLHRISGIAMSYTLVLIQSRRRFMGVLRTLGDLRALHRAHDDIPDMVRDSIVLLIRNPVEGREILVRTVDYMGRDRHGEGKQFIGEIAEYPGWDEIDDIVPLTAWIGDLNRPSPVMIMGMVEQREEGSRSEWFVDLRYLRHEVLRKDICPVHWSVPATFNAQESNGRQGSVFGSVIDYLLTRHNHNDIHAILAGQITVQRAPSVVSRQGIGRLSWRSFHRLCPGEGLRSWHQNLDVRDLFNAYDIFADPMLLIPDIQQDDFGESPHGMAAGAGFEFATRATTEWDATPEPQDGYTVQRMVAPTPHIFRR